MGIYSDYIFPMFYDQIVRHAIFADKRRETLKPVEGRVLEIGIGTGSNLDFYPESVSEIDAIDPNPGMEKQLRAKLLKKKIKVNFLIGSAEQLPYENETFQTVVSTLTMCSIPNLQKALSEISRVLTPNGKLIFFEHGLSAEPKIKRVQKFLNPIQNVVGCGCQLTVDVEAELTKADFTISSLKKDYLSNYPKFIAYIYEGCANPKK